MKKVYIIHGWGATPHEGWRPWLKEELEKQGFDVELLEMPETDNPTLEGWVGFMHMVIGMPDKNCYLVGHSLGCISILRYLESIRGDVKIGGAVLVAGPARDLGIKEVKSFFETDLNFLKIREHCKKFILINSDNDYYIPLEHGEYLSANLDAELIVKPGMKHFSSADGFKELPVVLESILKIVPKE